jgi:hypothetical protein
MHIIFFDQVHMILVPVFTASVTLEQVLPEPRRARNAWSQACPPPAFQSFLISFYMRHLGPQGQGHIRYLLKKTVLYD